MTSDLVHSFISIPTGYAMAPPPQPQQPYPAPAPYQGYPAPTYPIVAAPAPVSNNNQTTVVVQQQATQVSQATTVVTRYALFVCM